MRTRVQRAIERRFNRARYEATSVLNAFTDAAHRQVDVDTLTDDLTRVVAWTLRPATLALWLRTRPPHAHARAGEVAGA